MVSVDAKHHVYLHTYLSMLRSAFHKATTCSAAGYITYSHSSVLTRMRSHASPENHDSHLSNGSCFCTGRVLTVSASRSTFQFPPERDVMKPQLSLYILLAEQKHTDTNGVIFSPSSQTAMREATT